MASTGPNYARRQGCRCVHYIRRTVLAPPSRNNMGFMGVRRRSKGRWASEMRVPRTHSKSGRIWLGTFKHIEQAALAYDATVFCVYGEFPPAPRYFNYPEVPRPNIPEDIRLNLNGDDIKSIAENYAFEFYHYAKSHPPEPVPVPEPALVPAGGDPVVVDEADQAMPDLVDTDVPAATDVTSATATTATDDGNGNGNQKYGSMEELLAAVDFMFSMQLDDMIAFKEFANMGYGSW